MEPAKPAVEAPGGPGCNHPEGYMSPTGRNQPLLWQGCPQSRTLRGSRSLHLPAPVAISWFQAPVLQPQSHGCLMMIPTHAGPDAHQPRRAPTYQTLVFHTWCILGSSPQTEQQQLGRSLSGQGSSPRPRLTG